MLTREFHYQGRSVTVTLIVANHSWRWWYTIDQGLPVGPPDESHESKEDAIDAAIIDAIARIDQMLRP